MKIMLMNTTGYTHVFETMDGIEIKIIAKNEKEACYKLRQMFMNVDVNKLIIDVQI